MTRNPTAQGILDHEHYYDDRPTVRVRAVDPLEPVQVHRLLYADAYRVLTVYETCAHVWGAGGDLALGPSWAKGNRLDLTTVPEKT